MASTFIGECFIESGAGKVMDLWLNGNEGAGKHIYSYSRHNGANQVWRVFKRIVNGTPQFKFDNKHWGNMSLDGWGADTEGAGRGFLYVWHNDNNNQNQWWTLERVGGDRFVMRCVGSGKAVEDSNPNGNFGRMWMNAIGGATTHFHAIGFDILAHVSGGPTMIGECLIESGPNKVMDLWLGDGSGAGKRVYSWSRHNGTNQVWRVLKRVVNGTPQFKFDNKHYSHMSLDGCGADTEGAGRGFLYVWHNENHNAHQWWTLERAGGDRFVMRCVLSDKVIEDSNPNGDEGRMWMNARGGIYTTFRAINMDLLAHVPHTSVAPPLPVIRPPPVNSAYVSPPGGAREIGYIPENSPVPTDKWRVDDTVAALTASHFRYTYPGTDFTQTIWYGLIKDFVGVAMSSIAAGVMQVVRESQSQSWERRVMAEAEAHNIVSRGSVLMGLVMAEAINNRIGFQDLYNILEGRQSSHAKADVIRNLLGVAQYYHAHNAHMRPHCIMLVRKMGRTIDDAIARGLADFDILLPVSRVHHYRSRIPQNSATMDSHFSASCDVRNTWENGTRFGMYVLDALVGKDGRMPTVGGGGENMSVVQDASFLSGDRCLLLVANMRSNVDNIIPYLEYHTSEETCAGFGDEPFGFIQGGNEHAGSKHDRGYETTYYRTRFFHFKDPRYTQFIFRKHKSYTFVVNVPYPEGFNPDYNSMLLTALTHNRSMIECNFAEHIQSVSEVTFDHRTANSEWRGSAVLRVDVVFRNDVVISSPWFRWDATYTWD